MDESTEIDFLTVIFNDISSSQFFILSPTFNLYLKDAISALIK